MHSIADFVKETGLGNEDFEELLSGLNNDSLVSSELEAEDLISSSEDEEEVSVLDSHEGILNDLFKEDNDKLDLISQGQKDDKKHSKKIKPRFAAATICQTKVASTFVENSVERMGRFMSKLKVAEFSLKKSLFKGRSISSEVSTKKEILNKVGIKSAPVITYKKRGTMKQKRDFQPQ